MHRAQNHLDATLLSGLRSASDVTSCTLSSGRAYALSQCLTQDASSYLYSAIVSVGDAVRGVQMDLFTWSTVKLYYSVFYAMRSMLALDNVCIFYFRQKPFSVVARAGISPLREKGNTHEAVLEVFRRHGSDPFLMSQPIESSDPLEWLMEKRVDANYRISRFSEPRAPDHLKKIVRRGVRLAIQEYFADTTNTFLFDPEHAILAYPIKVIERALAKTRLLHPWSASNEEEAFLNKIFKDKNGPLPEFYRLLRP